MAEIIIFLFSLAALLYGANWVGESSAKIAKNFSVSPVLIGVTLLSIATALPEISLAFVSGLNGETDIGLGTILGSPIANIGLVLGLLLFFTQVDLKKAAFGRSIQILLFVLLLQFLLYFFSPSSQFSGVVLICLGVIFLFLESVISKEDKSYLERIFSNISNLKNFFSKKGNQGDLFLLLAGLVLLLSGSFFLIQATVSIAGFLNIPQIVIAACVIALGTSLPEGITALKAFLKKQPQLSAGNLVGSSILSLTFGLGILYLFGSGLLDQTSFFLVIATTSIMALATMLPILVKIPARLVGVALIAAYLSFILLFVSKGI